MSGFGTASAVSGKLRPLDEAVDDENGNQFDYIKSALIVLQNAVDKILERQEKSADRGMGELRRVSHSGADRGMGELRRVSIHSGTNIEIPLTPEKKNRTTETRTSVFFNPVLRNPVVSAVPTTTSSPLSSTQPSMSSTISPPVSPRKRHPLVARASVSNLLLTHQATLCSESMRASAASNPLPSSPLLRLLPRVFVNPSCLNDGCHRKEAVALQANISMAPEESINDAPYRCVKAVAHDAKIRIIADVLAGMLTVVEFWSVPFFIAWNAIQMDWFLYYMLISVIFWSFYIVLNAVTCYMVDGTRVEDPYTIFERYLRSWFFLDAAVVAQEWLTVALRFGAVSENAYLYLRLSRLLWVSRPIAMIFDNRTGNVSVMALRRLHDCCGRRYSQFAIDLVKIVMFAIWLSHICACAWWLFVLGFRTKSETGETWYAEMASALGVDSMADVVANHKRYTYSQALYWALAALFASESMSPPRSSTEAMFAAFVIIIGLLGASSLVSSVASLFLERRAEQREGREKLQLLQDFLDQYQVSPALCGVIRKEIVERMDVGRHLSASEVTLVGLLSQDKKATLWTEVYGPLITSSTFLGILRVVCDEFVRDLCTHAIDLSLLPPGWLLFPAGRAVVEASFVVAGRVQYTVDEGDTWQAQRREWICYLALWTQWTTLGAAEVASGSELLSLNFDDLKKVLLCYPRCLRIAHKYCETICTAIWTERVQLSDLSSAMMLDEGIIIRALPETERYNVSYPVLAALAQKGPKGVEYSQKLEAEVRAGKSYLCREGNEILRIVHVVLLKMVRDDSKVCVQLGCWDVKEKCFVTSKAKLPGIKMRTGDMPRTALERLLAKEFQRLSPTCSEGVLESSILVGTDSFGLTTQYVRKTYGASVSLPSEQGFHRAASAVMESENTRTVESEIEFVPLELSTPEPQEGTYLYGWLSQRHFDILAAMKHKTKWKIPLNEIRRVTTHSRIPPQMVQLSSSSQESEGTYLCSGKNFANDDQTSSPNVVFNPLISPNDAPSGQKDSDDGKVFSLGCNSRVRKAPHLESI